jgi:hypothetical protein
LAFVERRHNHQASQIGMGGRITLHEQPG